MPHPVPEWQHLAVYAIGAALLLMLLQRIPVVGKVIRFAFSLGLLAFLIFIVLQQAPYQPELARLTQSLGLDDQKVEGRELRVRMSPDGHFWVLASINGVKRRMLIDSGATVTAISEATAREAGVSTGATLTPIVLQTANGVGPKLAQTMLAVHPPRELRRAIATSDYASLVAVPGIGRDPG